MVKDIPRDVLTPKERLAALASGWPLDRPPCKPFLGQNAAKLFGSSNRAFNTDPRVTAAVLEAVFRRFRPDSVSVNAGLQCVAEALGAVFRFPEFGPPVLETPGLADYGDLEGLFGRDVTALGRLPNFFEAFEDVRGRIGEEVGVDISLGGPLTTAAYLVGPERLLKDVVLRPEEVRRTLALTTKAVSQVVKKAAAIGAAVGLAEPVASCAVVSPRAFRGAAKDPLAEICLLTRSLRGVGLSLHVCGRTKAIWPDLAEVGLAAFSLDNLESLAEAKKALGGSMTLVGNVPPVEILKDGRPEDVLASARACLDAAGDSPGGFILASGCEVLLDTPPENIQAMMDAARLYGRRD